MTDAHPTRQRLIVLGATGSIGVNTLDVVDHLNADCGYDFQVVGLAAGNNVRRLIEQATHHRVPNVAIADASHAGVLAEALPNVRIFAGPDAAEQLVQAVDAEVAIAAVVGSAGLPATIAAIKKGMRIGLANKETLVAAGELVTPLVRQHRVELIPVDSEHSAIFQCLASEGPRTVGQASGDSSSGADSESLGPWPSSHGPSSVKRIVLTASGGPFRRATKAEIDNATVDQALNHPTWNMGPKITIDSATMMNKALEIIEAHWLFDLPASQIDVIIHPQSIAHSFVEFADNSVLAQLGPPDMRTPIQYALTWPHRPAGCSRALDWTTLSKLEFEQPDHDRFPALKLAYDVINAGGTAGAIFNAANEAAVAAFLDRRIRFGRIVELVAEALNALPAQAVTSLDDIHRADEQARQYVNDAIEHAVDQLAADNR